MPKLKLAIIGATGSGLKRTIPALQHSRVVEVVAIHGRDREKLKSIQQRFGISSIYTETMEMLARETLDMIYIATPPFLHLPDITDALTIRKPIICEKPVAQNVAEAERISRLVTASNVPFMVAHHLRHQRAMLDVKTMLQSKTIGDVTSVWCQWAFQMNLNATNALWKTNPELGGNGAFADAGIHLIDLMIYFFGQPAKVVGHGFKLNTPIANDNATAILCYPQHSATLNASQTTPPLGNHLLIYGTKGKVEAFGAIGEKSVQKVVVQTPTSIETLTYSEVNLYGAEVEAFASSVASGSTDPQGTSLQEALIGMRVLESINQSISTGASVSMQR